ncbi:MAG: lytic transglycosylase domain-containing protein [Gammaproteobacteria bacterium]|nr:lytic transglycosylase domain-containing protein [Gammaproteobacteria bacterium]
MLYRALTLLLLLIFGLSANSETFIYQEKDGTRWITDRALNPQEFEFIDKYGRPTATKSCKGVTDVILENRANRYMPRIRNLALEQQLEPELVKAIITVESCFDARAVSRAGAHGLMQLMPGTARNYGVHNRFDPDQNLKAGIRHFRELMDQYRDNLRLALAAYNAGAHNVKKYKGVPPFRETQNYVTKVMDYFERYKQQSGIVPISH